MPQTYITVAVITLLVIAGLLVLTKRIQPKSKPSLLAGIAVAFMVAGIVFGENRLVGYSLMGVGILLALADTVKKLKSSPLLR